MEAPVTYIGLPNMLERAPHCTGQAHSRLTAGIHQTYSRPTTDVRAHSPTLC